MARKRCPFLSLNCNASGEIFEGPGAEDAKGVRVLTMRGVVASNARDKTEWAFRPAVDPSRGN